MTLSVVMYGCEGWTIEKAECQRMDAFELWCWWCRPAISSSIVPFSSCPQSLPASESFTMSQLFAWGGQSIGVSALALPMNTQDWSPLGWTSWISFQSKGLSRVFYNTIVQKHQFFDAHLCYIYEMTDVQSTSCWNHFIMYVGQITVLYTLTLL